MNVLSTRLLTAQRTSAESSKNNSRQPRRLALVLTAWIFLLGIAGPAAADSRAPIQSRDFFVVTSDGISIHVREKFRGQGHKVPVLLVHGTFSDSRIWDFPNRSVMDSLAARGHHVYALDLRGMGQSHRPPNYFTIGLSDRVRDLEAVAQHIVATAGRPPVVAGWSQGGLLTAMFAASAPHLVEGVGLFSIPGNGFVLPPAFVPIIGAVVASGVDRFLAPPDMLYAIAFAFDPLTGKPTISNEAFGTFAGMMQPDSVRAVLEFLSPDFFPTVMIPIWPTLRMPALVVDGALDLTVGATPATALFDALGSAHKKLVVLPRNAHGWFLEDNFRATLRPFATFLAEFNDEEHEEKDDD